MDRQLSDAFASCSENRMASAAEIAASMEFRIFGDESPAYKKGGLLQEQ
jgi:hypothetical protein